MITGDFEPQVQPIERLADLYEERYENLVQPVKSLLGMIEAGVLQVSEKLYMSYKPRGGEEKRFEATVNSDGSLSLFGQVFNTPSSAALVGKMNAGGSGKTVNGWTTWKNHAGKTLDALRKEHASITIPSINTKTHGLDEALKIGEYVQSIIRILKEKEYSFSKEQIAQLTSKKWCGKNLSISYPLFLVKTDKVDERKDAKGRPRYYSTPHVFGGVEYYLTSQLIDKGNTRSKLRKWFLSL